MAVVPPASKSSFAVTSRGRPAVSARHGRFSWHGAWQATRYAVLLDAWCMLYAMYMHARCVRCSSTMLPCPLHVPLEARGNHEAWPLFLLAGSGFSMARGEKTMGREGGRAHMSTCIL